MINHQLGDCDYACYLECPSCTKSNQFYKYFLNDKKTTLSNVIQT